MIRVDKPEPPQTLLTRGAAATEELCRQYDSAPPEYQNGNRTLEFDSSIYGARDVKESLKAAQHEKCAFCESRFSHVAYGDVEHFRPKAGYKQREADSLKRPGYYWLAYAWSNLYYSCQLCNQRFKKNLFPLRDGRKRAKSHHQAIDKEVPLLVDPGVLDPTSFVGFREEYAFAIDDSAEGATTIDVLGLNREELAEIRRDRLESVKQLVGARTALLNALADAPSPEIQARLEEIENFLALRLHSTAEYSAMLQALSKPNEA
jgi:uncharacterized protein (TIGR02646 family)